MKNLKNFIETGIVILAGSGFFGCKEYSKNNFGEMDKIMVEHLREKYKEKQEKIKFYEENYKQMLEFITQDCNCPEKQKLKVLGSYKFNYKSAPLVCFYSNYGEKKISIYEKKDNNFLFLGKYNK